ncbi:MAG: 23S rRNA (adenine(2503)-C(2))-methyltransferase RlmN [Cephaloticoccus sp.]|nr:23S rRNA (adenine(2503)-C(2))-methyltransferase RlmN [Cephaloticoccus sp.]
MRHLLNLDDELMEWLGMQGQPAYRAKQLHQWLFEKRASNFDDMTNLSKSLRTQLTAEFQIWTTQIAKHLEAGDGTEKLLLELADGGRIECVLLRDESRRSICISSQVGCAMGCVFCATGQMGYTRHLTVGEIVAQAVHVQRTLRAENHRLRNIVLMGMGEPLHNFDAVMKAIDICTDGTGLGLAADRITLSTVGVVPGILRLAREQRKAFHLAVSLHAATQAERAAIVPAARKWPLDELMAACRTYSETTGRRIFYEWTLIEGKNDSPEHARAVGRLLDDLPAQVNLIPLNPTQGYDGTPTRSEAARKFQDVLIHEFGIPSTVRQRRGIDIAAGCGQLAVAEKQGLGF